MSNIRVITALDYPDAASALECARRLKPELCALKVGKELFTAAGPQLVSKLQELGFKIFLDLKFHDIPNTTAKAVAAAARLGVWMVNVHCSGGRVMMEAAAEAAASQAHKPILIGVTVLTSMDEAQLKDLGITDPIDEVVLRLAALAKECGLDGVVSSAREAALIKERIAKPFVNVTPGIRPAGAALGDQKRVLTPLEALKAGADYLVIGRPITQAADPVAALERINAEIKDFL
ncbi:MAG: orotidine-5'-phosphate decarboxylase [Proteobacteria bacterium]|uniref:Orotidine 5'-phosphate decarboxylase n=1 Tax=Candidatus Avisuccinivibrio stercorigallinarum TaxID=2840704 RepID=A0A9D9DBS9_9GAMM|nr:orotidine-5'-phosphate decarboxylase [Candidatus Avisuccinivibrio stercorigallinarum]